MKTGRSNYLKNIGALALMLITCSLQAAEQKKTVPSDYSHPLFIAMALVVFLLAVVVIVLGSALRNVIGSEYFIEKLKSKQNDGKSHIAGPLMVLIMLSVLPSVAQENSTTQELSTVGGLSSGVFYTLAVMIGLELVVLGILMSVFKRVTGSESVLVSKPKKAKATKSILDKINDTVTIEEESKIMLDHSYDGITELDNNLPPWWKYGFYLTILVAVVYMINYHVTKTSPLQAEEYKIAVKTAEAEVAEFMKNSANNVDETTVKLLTDKAEISAGQNLFVASCAACHGRAGEGGVGPNLTDEYWLHSGGVKDIFKTIKYGWPDKGMKSWKDDFSPVQIAQLASFIKSIKGTNPANAKEKQGDVYVEEGAPADTLAKQQTEDSQLTSEVLK